ncbi:hypothetical protein ACH4E8_22780 [Streptomyces sp. NPDC017979]|uniref:hypothetical protein n=1 Tax=Streptomyces sp. NPDC017979 TaxID=3365024 RepID=UPI00378CAA25
MRRRRQRAVLAAAALCLGGALTACGGSSDGDGYAAVGAGTEGAPDGAVPPKGEIELIPLEPGSPSGASSKSTGPGSGSATPPSPSAGTTSTPPSGGSGASASDASSTGVSSSGTSPSGTSPSGAAPGTSSGTSGPPAPPGAPGTPPGAPGARPPSTAPTSPPGPRPPAGPAALTVGDPVRKELDKRWCEEVTVEFRNSGGTAVTSGTATFETHVIGALGVDWATIKTSQPLPAPIAAGAKRTQAYAVCVDAWRVPLGMRIETQDVTAVWK